MYIFSKRIRCVGIFSILYLVAGLAFAVHDRNGEFIFYGGVVCVLLGIITYMDYRVRFSMPLLWGLSCWGLIHLAGGLVPILPSITDPGSSQVLYGMRIYPDLPRFDQIVHAYGYGMATWAAYQALCARFKQRLPLDSAVIFSVFLIACGLGAVNEIIEFIAVLSLTKTDVGGYVNTGWDLVSNATGSILAIAILAGVRSFTQDAEAV